jgi:glutathione synthase/RimK-type ligase-like ATP-grasp enzyme
MHDRRSPTDRAASGPRWSRLRIEEAVRMCWYRDGREHIGAPDGPPRATLACGPEIAANLPPMPTIALLTDARYTAPTAPPGDWYLANILADDALLADALGTLGLRSERVDWADPQVDWTRFDAAVLRTTWDYYERIDEFRAWLPRVSAATRLLNPSSLVTWNLDKRYLLDLAAEGLPVAPTRVLPAGDLTPLAALLADTGWTDAVIKPCVSGAARLTFRVSPDSAGAVDRALAPYRAREPFLLQPFLPRVLDEGEVTLMVMGGEVTHAVRKRAKPGDFRVQDDHGGTVHPHTPTRDEVAVALRAMATVRPAPVYGRVDLVRADDGTPCIMELELIEPELWLRLHPPAARTFAHAIARALGHGHATTP